MPTRRAPLPPLSISLIGEPERKIATDRLSTEQTLLSDLKLTINDFQSHMQAQKVK